MPEEFTSCDSLTEIDKGRRPLYAKHPMTKFAWTTAEDIHTVCTHSFLLNLQKVENFIPMKMIHWFY